MFRDEELCTQHDSFEIHGVSPEYAESHKYLVLRSTLEMKLSTALLNDGVFSLRNRVAVVYQKETEEAFLYKTSLEHFR